MKFKNPKSTPLFKGAVAIALASAAILSARADYPSTVTSQGPVGYWRLNETTVPQPSAVFATNSGSLGSAANGLYSNTPAISLSGPFAGSAAVTLNGVNQAVVTPWVPGLNTSAFSFEVWANPAQVPKFAYLAASVVAGSPRSGWYMAQDDGSTFSLGSAFVVRMFYQNTTTPSVTLSAPVSVANVWYHIVLTYDGTTASLYTNGVLAQSAVPLGYVANVSAPFCLGQRSDNNFWWPGKVAESAMYGAALSPAQVAAHYAAATTAPATYGATVLGDSPLLFDRFQGGASPIAANSGTLGSAVNGLYFYDALPNQAGPRPAPFPGFTAGNAAVAFDAGPGSVVIPPFNFTTNNVTITGWVKPNGPQSVLAGVFTGPAGIQFDFVNGGFELAYNWNGTAVSNTETFISIPDATWSYVALMVQPTQAVLYVPGQTPFTNFAAHPAQNFNVNSLIGNGAAAFNGTLDEMAFFNRTLGLGEAYSQYASAVGGLGPQIFSDPQGPVDVIVGDTLTLSVDAGGTPNLSYVWRRNGTPVPGGTTNPLSKPNVILADAGNYDVVITNLYGAVTSGVAVVTTELSTAPVILQGPVGRTFYTGGTLDLTVVASGGGLKYQWKRSATNLPGATSSAYFVGSVTTNNAGSYTVSVTNSLGATNLGPAVITIPSVSTGSYAGLVISSAPEAWWRLDEAPGSTNMYDGMGRHDGIYTNLNSTIPPVALGAVGIAPPDTAASFTANSGIGLVPYSAALNGPVYSYEGWAKTTALGNYQVPFGSGDGVGGIWMAMVTGTSPVTWEPGGPGGYYDIWTTGGNIFSNLITASGIWTHLVLEYDSTRVISGTHYPWTVYVNGVTDGFVWTLGANTINASGPFVVGGFGSDPATIASGFFNGLVDEVAVYPRGLAGNEILAHYNAGNAGVPPTPPSFTPAFLPQTVTTGKSVSFSTIVQGTAPLSVQWYKGASPIPGATSASYSIASTALTDTGVYTLWATNSAGTNSQSVTLTVISPTSYANVTNGSVLHLRFDGNTLDTSGHGNDGTAVGSPAFVVGLIGPKAIQYTTTSVTNGSGNPSNVTVSASSYVGLGLPADLQFGAGTSFTIGLWVKLPVGAVGGDLPFIGTGVGSMNNPGWDMGPTYGSGGWQWCLNDGVTVQPLTNNVDVNGAANSINDGNWHNFVLSVDRTTHTAKSYLDSLLLTVNDITALGSLNNGSAVTIGQDPTGIYPEISPATANDLTVWGPLQTATLDDLGVWVRALTPLEVTQIQSAGSSGHSFDTVAPPSVTLTVTRSGANVILSWTSGTLLQSPTLGPTAVWTPVPGATAPSYTVTPATGIKFYRVLVQ